MIQEIIPLNEGYLNVLTISTPHNFVNNLTKDSGFEFKIDFQETPIEYRNKRMKQLREKYPIPEYIWTFTK